MGLPNVRQKEGLMKTTILGIFLAVLVGCGSNSSDKSSDPTGIENGNTSRTAEVISSFGMSAGGSGAFVAFYTGNRYAAGMIRQVSGNRFQAAASTGMYEENGTNIITHGKRTSCPQMVSKGTKIVGHVSGSSIVLTNSQTTAVLPRTSSVTLGTGFFVEWGCFDQNGNFTQNSWSDIN